MLRSLLSDTHYAREVLLSCGCSGKMVQYGIVRLNLTCLDDECRRDIESERIPLGRALIKHDVLRKVRLLSLWKIVPADVLQALFRLDGKETCYGRTALIYCNECRPSNCWRLSRRCEGTERTRACAAGKDVGRNKSAQFRRESSLAPKS